MDATRSDLQIRPVRTSAEYAACVDLQRDTWGASFSEHVPRTMLDITAKMGGVVTGAFDAAGVLQGFVYGITGVRRGQLAHWSHMLAVRSEARDQGIGRRLKEAQREEMRALGVRTVYWTFDPLVARNAHFNMNVLGAAVDEFVVDMYGQSDSKLHRLGTDRFIMRWDLDAAPPGGRHGAADGAPNAAVPENAAAPDLAARSSDQPAPGPAPADHGPGHQVTEVRIPNDIEAVEARAFDEAVEWRRSTRRVFRRLLDDSWCVSAFIPGPSHGRYLVVRTPASRPSAAPGEPRP